MATAYPDGLDSLKSDVDGSTDTMESVPHDALHNDANAAINAIETALGTNPAGSASTVAARIAAMEARAAGPTYGAQPDDPAEGDTWITKAVKAFVAVGTSQGQYSMDGKTWAAGSSSTSNMQHVIWCDELALFVCMGYGAKYSTDGETWAGSSLPSPASHATGLAWSQDLSIMVATTSGSAPLWSVDGKTWTVGTCAATDGFGDVAWSSDLGLFATCAYGVPYYSTDGKAWTAGTGTTAYVSAIAWSPDLALFAGLPSGSGSSYYSTDGKTWSVGQASVGFYDGNMLWVPEKSMFVMAGAYSVDGKNWTASTGDSGARCVAWSADLSLFVSAATNAVFYSADGEAWTAGSGLTGQVSGVAAGPIGTSLKVYDGGWQDVGGDTGAMSSVNGKTPDGSGDVTLDAADVGARPDDWEPAWDDITDKPAVIAAGADAPTARGVIGAGTSSFSGAYSDLSGKPSTFPPTTGTTSTTALAGNTPLVPPTRTVTAGTGLTGGGDLSADRTFAVSYGTAAGTAAQGNDSRITGAVQSTRTVSAGTGLTGGGDLCADRTFAADFGTAAGKVAQGNDSRFVGVPVTTQTSAYTLVAGDAGSIVEVNSASAVNVTVPASTFAAGQIVEVCQYGAGQVTLVAASGVTLRSANGLKISAQYGSASIRFRSATEAVVAGAMAS